MSDFLKRLPGKTLVVAMMLLAGCVSTPTKQYQNSGVVDYLYPDSQMQEVHPEVPLLTLPLKVGIAFTPDGLHGAGMLTEARKIELSTRISEQFKTLDFVKKIEVIPSGYLRLKGGFENLGQLKRMFDIDVIALVSYDQTHFTDEGLASFAYWTIVGAYIVPAEKNTTHTLMDAVIYDISSRKMLFRAPGLSTIKSNATPVNLSEQRREDAEEGLMIASDNLVDNLQLQLSLFKERVKQSPDDFKVVNSPGYQGGAMDWWVLIVLGALVYFRKKNQSRLV